jgi:hypothetical protein
MKCSLQKEMKNVTYEGKRESHLRWKLVTVSLSVQKYSVQYTGYNPNRGYNLIRVATVEGGTTRGTPALVYYSIHSSLYTGAVHCV